MMGNPNIPVGTIDLVIVIMLGFSVFLLVAYFNYDKSPFLKGVADVFIKLSFVKRTKTDLLLFALIPFFIGLMFLVFRLMLG